MDGNDEFDNAAQKRAHGQRRRGGRGPSAGSERRRSSGPPPVRERAKPTAEPETAKPARELLENILARLGVEGAEIVFISRSEGDYLEVRGENLASLNGKHGNTLEALNLIFNNILNVGVRNNRKYYTIDAEGYRARRADQLKTLALATLERVVREQKPVALEPMLPSERKIVHLALSESPFVRTESEGVDPDRRLVVFPKDA
jgi:spoIIIJ-associated protein